MTIYRLDALPPTTNSVTRRLIGFASDVADRVGLLWRARRSRRDVKRLLEFDDRILSDIGLTRGDVVAAISGTRDEDPGQRLGKIASERRAADIAAAERLRDAHPSSRAISG